MHSLNSLARLNLRAVEDERTADRDARLEPIRAERDTRQRTDQTRADELARRLLEARHAEGLNDPRDDAEQVSTFISARVEAESSFHARVRGAIDDMGGDEVYAYSGTHPIGCSGSVVDAFQALLALEFRQTEESAATVDHINGFMLRLASDASEATLRAVVRDAFHCGILGTTEGWVR